MEQGLSQTLVEVPTSGLNFYRPHRRVILLLFLAPVFYEVWWYWQLFTFTRREGFPRARRFFFILIPFYGWVVLYRQFDDLQGRALRAGVRAFSSKLAIWLVIFSWWAGGVSNRLSNNTSAFVAAVISGVLISVVGALVQPSANAYLGSKYPDASPVGMTWGEITAAVLGFALSAVLVIGAV